MKKETTRIMLKAESKLQNDHLFPVTEMKPLRDLTGIESRRGLDNVILSDGKIVNVVSNSYGHLPNDRFFMEVERGLISADINYRTRQINRDNRSFAADYILNDDRYIIKIKSGNDLDIIQPMLRFVNSYDGSNKTSGSFGFFRQVCSNGLHVAQSEVGFNLKHRGEVVEFVLPEIESLINKFIDNEFYTLARKFEVLAERPITNIKDWVKMTADKTKLFKFEASDKNPEPSANARQVMETMNREMILLNTEANAWIGYNAFNEVLHDKLKKSFTQQAEVDSRLFAAILS
jgi:hypothetical protein